MVFFLILNCFNNNLKKKKKNHLKVKTNLIIHAIKNIQNNCALKLVEIIKYL